MFHLFSNINPLSDIYVWISKTNLTCSITANITMCLDNPNAVFIAFVIDCYPPNINFRP